MSEISMLHHLSFFPEDAPENPSLTVSSEVSFYCIKPSTHARSAVLTEEIVSSYGKLEYVGRQHTCFESRTLKTTENSSEKIAIEMARW